MKKIDFYVSKSRENPLYTKRSGVHLMLGDAKESLSTMIAWLN
ncbi:MAG: NAD(P)(+) transhydrogenase (Re/Si-specific) subunit beta [Bacteroidales bacterium]|nr:NAD(P)(+) transhydrogenase (Re/Si-specific) subunit beta [Bacteroidales bacterium]